MSEMLIWRGLVGLASLVVVTQIVVVALPEEPPSPLPTQEAASSTPIAPTISPSSTPSKMPPSITTTEPTPGPTSTPGIVPTPSSVGTLDVPQIPIPTPLPIPSPSIPLPSIPIPTPLPSPTPEECQRIPLHVPPLVCFLVGSPPVCVCVE